MTMKLSTRPGSFGRGRCVRVFEPAGVEGIMFGDPVDLARDEIHRYVLYLFCGDAAIDGTALDPGAFEYDSACGDDGIAADLCIVHDDGAHADEHFIAQRAAMYDGVMADGDVVADDGPGFLVGGMDDDAVLDIDFVADADAVDVTADDGIEPDAAFIAYLYVADDGGIGSDETILAEFGEFTFDGENGGHRRAFCLCEYPKIFLTIFALSEF